MFDDIPRPTCRSVYTVSDKHLRHGGSGYETTHRHAHTLSAEGILAGGVHSFLLNIRTHATLYSIYV